MNPSLDINSPRGRKAADDQMHATNIVFGKSPDFAFVHTQTDNAAAVDGIIVKNGFASGIAEVKSRDMTFERLMGEFVGEWLLTLQKLKDMADVSRLLCLPGYGMLYLVPSRVVLVVQLTAATGQIVCRYRTDVTETQKTCNGGKVVRENAYIQMRTAKVYRE